VLATEEDVLRARDCGVDGIGLSLPAGSLQIDKKLKWPRPKVIERAVELSRLAHDIGLRVTISPYDTLRAERSFLREYIESVHAHGHIDRIRVVDTVGCGTMARVAEVVSDVRRWTQEAVPVEVHCHDDFGLGVANTLAGVVAGASAVSTTMNGIGERAGNAATEQIVAGLELLYGCATGIDLTQLREVCAEVAAMTSIPLDPYAPIVGSMTFSMESGSIVAGYLSDELIAFPFSPRLVGRTPTVILGKKTGRHAVAHKAAELGFAGLASQTIEELVVRVKDYSEQSGAPVSDILFAEWLADAAAVLGGRPRDNAVGE